MKTWLVIAQFLWPAWVGSAGEARLCPFVPSAGAGTEPGLQEALLNGQRVMVWVSAAVGWVGGNHTSHLGLQTCPPSRPGVVRHALTQTLLSHAELPRKVPINSPVSEQTSVISLTHDGSLSVPWQRGPGDWKWHPVVQDTEAGRGTQVLEMKLVLTDDPS